MASIQKKGDSFYCQFCFRGKRHTFTVGPVAPAEAQAKRRQVDYVLMRLKQGLLTLPDGCDIVTFVGHDGRPPAAGPTLPDAPRKAVALGHLRDRYVETHGNGTLEANSLYTCRIHLAHFCTFFGDGFAAADLTAAELQKYVNARAKAKVAAATIRKENCPPSAPPGTGARRSA